MRALALLSIVCTALFAGGCGGCGDDDGSAADGGDFVLVSRTPEPDDGNVWVRAPIVLTFSRALDAATVSDDSIALSVAGAPLAHETSLSDDGTTVSLVISEPPATPAVVDIEVTGALMDDAGDAFAGEVWSFTLPPWQHAATAGAIGGTGRPALVVDASGVPVVAFIDDGGDAVVRRLDGGAWSDLGALGAAAEVRLAVGGDALVAATFGDSGVALAEWSGSSWESLGALASGGIDARPLFDVAVDGDGNAVVAMFSASAVQVARWNGQELVSEPPLEAVAVVRDLALAVDGALAVVAVVSGPGVLRTFRQKDAGWEELSGGVDFSAAERPDLVAADGVIALSWQKDDSAELATRHAYAARWNPDGGWLRTAHAADLDIQADAMATAIALDGDQVTMAWFEGDSTSRKVYAARATTDDASWTFLDSALSSNPSADAIEPSLALDQHGDPVAAFAEDGQVMVARWNASPSLRRGLAERLPAGGCAIPEDAPPATLADTGCYADVAGHQLAPQLIPFEINSPLWSDGALKRRFLLVPDGDSIGYTDAGALTMPVGTLLVKEFWLERIADDPKTRFPIETRFLVKRCEEGDCLEPWQGYSYRWKADGSEADLIDPGSEDEKTDWTITIGNGTDVMHTHIYPSRLNCTRCHNAVAGRVLGLQAIQLDRPARYGDVIDNQLDTLAAIGVLTGLPSARPARLPSSLDPSFDYQSRSRAYYHANCAHCHRPAGERPTIDFRFQSPLAANNICDKLTPGDGTGSILYIRDSTRGAGQMPPLASDDADDYQLGVTAAWIDGMSSCP